MPDSAVPSSRVVVGALGVRERHDDELLGELCEVEAARGDMHRQRRAERIKALDAVLVIEGVLLEGLEEGDDPVAQAT
jgi:hypothetical protein